MMRPVIKLAIFMVPFCVEAEAHCANILGHNWNSYGFQYKGWCSMYQIFFPISLQTGTLVLVTNKWLASLGSDMCPNDFTTSWALLSPTNIWWIIGVELYQITFSLLAVCLKYTVDLCIFLTCDFLFNVHCKPTNSLLVTVTFIFRWIVIFSLQFNFSLLSPVVFPKVHSCITC